MHSHTTAAYYRTPICPRKLATHLVTELGTATHIATVRKFTCYTRSRFHVNKRPISVLIVKVGTQSTRKRHKKSNSPRRICLHPQWHHIKSCVGATDDSTRVACFELFFVVGLTNVPPARLYLLRSKIKSKGFSPLSANIDHIQNQLLGASTEAIDAIWSLSPPLSLSLDSSQILACLLSKCSVHSLVSIR